MRMADLFTVMPRFFAAYTLSPQIVAGGRHRTRSLADAVRLTANARYRVPDASHLAYPAIVITIQRITPQSPLYASAVALRESVLLSPIGYDHARFIAEYPSVDKRAEHFVAVMEHPTGPKVVGCLLLLTDEAPGETGTSQAKVMQMAVDPQRQGEGLGRRLVVAAEARAFGELGLSRLYCHAQDRAIGFYESLGWTPEGEPFEEAGIGHRKMVLDAPPQPSGDAASVLEGDPLYGDGV